MAPFSRDINQSPTDIDYLQHSHRVREYFVLTRTYSYLRCKFDFLSRIFLLAIIHQLINVFFTIIIFPMVLTKKKKVILKKIKSGNELMLVECTCLARFFFALK